MENTGQQNSTTVNLTLEERDDSGCGNAGGLTAELSDSTVTLDAEDEDDDDANKQVVFVDVEVPDGQEADDYCWEVTGTVTTPNPTKRYLIRLIWNSKFQYSKVFYVVIKN